MAEMKRAFRLSLGLLVLLVALAAVVVGWRSYLVHELRKPVLAELSDPDSALFRDEAYYGPWTLGSGVLCGEVNAKNGFGAYSGYTGFESFDTKTAIIQSGALKGLKVGSCDQVEPSKLPWWWIRW